MMTTTNEPKRHLRVLTNSELATFRRCPREHYYRYRLLRRPLRTADALRFGTLIHKALEAWWSVNVNVAGDAGIQAQLRLTAALDALREHGKGSDPYELATARALLIGYTARWGGEQHAAL